VLRDAFLPEFNSTSSTPWDCCRHFHPEDQEALYLDAGRSATTNSQRTVIMTKNIGHLGQGEKMDK
jgi:hypothetical protein